MAVSQDTDYRLLPLEEMQARVTKFEDQVRAALVAAPPSADLIRGAVRREGVQRCPVWLRRVSPDLVIRYGDQLIDLFREFPDDLGRVAPYDILVGSNQKSPIGAVEALMKDAQWVNEWGVGWRHVVGGVGASEASHPLADWSGLDDYLTDGFPDPRDPGRLAPAVAPAMELRKAGKYTFGLFGSALYHLFSIRGIENALMDFHTNEAEMRRLIDSLCDYAIELTRCWASLDVDALLFTDDWGTQESLLISPATWRSFFKTSYKRLFEATHRAGLDVFFHTCGNVTEIVDDLIEIGMDALDPVQTSAMDIDELARRFGGRVTFCGAIDVQHLLPYATPGQIKDTIKRTSDILGRPFGNALILAPTNVITPDVSFENLRAMFEACHEK